MPCIRIQMLAESLETMDPIELLGRCSQCLADVVGGENRYVMALWEPQEEKSTAPLKIDVLGLTDDDLPDSGQLASALSDLLKVYLPELESKAQLTIRESERSEWDAWEAGAVDGYRVVYGLYAPGRAYERQD